MKQSDDTIIPGATSSSKQESLITVTSSCTNFEREELSRPFGFKGGYLSELWQVVCKLTAAGGEEGVGMATQSVLYGDAGLFSCHSEAEGNALMYLLTAEAARLVTQTPFLHPPDLLQKVLPAVKKRALQLTLRHDLNDNFIYNALVSVDNAAWLLYARCNGFTSFDQMLPAFYQPALAYRNKHIAIMFQVPYGMPMSEIAAAADAGYFVFKIKTGAPGTQAEMLEADMQRLTLIHQTLMSKRSTATASGKVWYTMDANARYEKKETFLRYIDHAKTIGALEQVLLYEEPLVEDNDEDVADVGVRVAADESIRDEQSALRRIGQGYGAVVLKGIAKTLSASLAIAKIAHDHGVPCLCSDLTVNPVLVDWHKNLAARIAPFPGIDMGMMETNGDMNYKHWQTMLERLPVPGAAWVQRANGVFTLDDDFYQRSAGIFQVHEHYRMMC